MKVFLVGGTNNGLTFHTNDKMIHLGRRGCDGVLEEYFVHELRIGDTKRYLGLVAGKDLVDGFDRLVEGYTGRKR